MIEPPASNQARAPSSSSAAQEQQYDLEPRVLLLGVAFAVVSIVFIAGGVAWPRAAGSLLRLLLAALAVAVVAGRAWHALAHVKARQKGYTPFDGIVASRQRPAAPQTLRKLAATFQAADDPEAAQRATIPWSTQQTLRAEVTRRLAEHHSLNIDDASHHAHIRALVSEPTQTLIMAEPNTSAGERAAFAPHLTMSHLHRILEDVEQL